jgi:hypothetical protein
MMPVTYCSKYIYIYLFIFAFSIDLQGKDAFRLSSKITPMLSMTSYVEETILLISFLNVDWTEVRGELQVPAAFCPEKMSLYAFN